MREYEVRKTQFTVTDFLSWQREGSLDINPPFQRRSVWKPEAKSYFIDTVVKGLPAPIVYLRQKVDLDTQKTIREVVDGQQRLRTIFTYIDPTVLKDFNSTRDSFSVKPIHNEVLAGHTFQKLPRDLRERILSYEFSTHVLPINIEDREVLEMFARLNATGVKLNAQELRNAEFFGEFKSSVYNLALEQLDRWLKWEIFTTDQISRMKEVEMTSDLVLNMIHGLVGKSKVALDNIYKEFDECFTPKKVIEERFRQTLDYIDKIIGVDLKKTVFKHEIYFFTLFVYIYDKLYGLGNSLKKRTHQKIKTDIKGKLISISNEFDTKKVPGQVLCAIQRKAADLNRRKIRLDYFRNRIDGKTD